jgi:hypothetical protein
LSCLLAVPLSAAVTVAAPTAAHADTLVAPAIVQSAARDFGNGGAATAALVHAGATTTAADGAVVFFDSAAKQIRRVDPTSGVVSAIAGKAGAVTPGCDTVDTTVAATDAAVPAVHGLWSDAAGDLFIWPGGSSNCFDWGNVYRLDHADGMWHLVVKQPTTPCCNTWNGAYHAVAVDGAGDVFVSDTVNSVIREFTPGADPTSAGTVVAGTAGHPGSTGDGGLATAATVQNPDVLAAAADGSVFLANYHGHTIRRVDATTGIISTVAGNGTAASAASITADAGSPATNVAIDVASIAVGPDGTVYFNDNYGVGAAERSFTVGGPVATVVGPASPNSDGDPALCPGETIAPHGTDLLVSCGRTLRSWPANGSAATQAGTPFAGLAAPSGADSADGATVADVFLSDASRVAAAPDGSVLVATTGAVRRLSGTGDAGTLDTVAALTCVGLAVGADSTAYCSVGTGTAGDPFEIVGVHPDKSQTVVAGGGASPLANGAAATDVALPGRTDLAVDRAAGILYFGAGAQVWAADLAAGTVTAVAGNGATQGAVTDSSSATSVPLPGLFGMAVDQASHALYLATDPASTTISRVDQDGSLHVLGGTSAAPYAPSMVVAPDGTIYLSSLGTVVALHANGASAADFPRLGGPVAVLASGDLLSLRMSRDDGSGGLLQTVTPPDASFPGQAATATAGAGPASITVTVTPPAVTGELVTITATQSPAAPLWTTGGVTLGSFATNGDSTPRSFTYYRYGPNAQTGPGFSSANTYRVAVYTTASAGQLSATSAPAVTTGIAPQVDTTAPSAPAFTVDDAALLNWHLTVPTDPDVAKVLVRWVAGDVAPATPSDGVGQDYVVSSSLTPGQTTGGSAAVDRYQDYTLAAWATDTSGNLSAPTVVTRTKARLLAGSPVSGLGYQWQGNGDSMVFWTGGYAIIVRYAAGTTIPVTPIDGTDASLLGSGWGTGAHIPVAAGAKVAVAVFNLPGAAGNTFQRAGFVLTGGTSSDTLTTTGPTSVTAGARPVLVATLTRHGPLATTALAGVNVELLKRAAGASTWTSVNSGYTSATGTVSLTAPVQRVTTAYEVRTVFADPLPVASTRTVAVRTSISAVLSATTVPHGRSVTVHGVFSPAARVPVQLQRYYSRAWHTVATQVTQSTGFYAFKFVPPTKGSYPLRVYFAGSAAYLASASPTRTLTAS